MLKKQINREGFTIIEVLIVLAIAGLIMLLVFLAVPALQRNSRNTSRKDDVSRVGSAVSDWSSNNNGDVPTNSDKTTITDSVGNLSQYDTANISVVDGSSTAQGPITDVKDMKIVTGAQCDTDGKTKTGSKRQTAIIYALENSGSTPTAVCTDI